MLNTKPHDGRFCEWCAGYVGQARKFCRVLVLPAEYGNRKLYFHEKCLEKFKEANPNIMRQKENEALQRNG